MKQLGLAYFTDTHLTAIALILFFLFFCSLIFWLKDKRQKNYFQRMAMTPFENGDDDGR